MLHREKHPNIMALAPQLLEHGQIPAKSVLLRQVEDIDDTIYPMNSQKNQQPEQITSMQECLPKNKKVICVDKQSSLKKNIRISKLSRILAQDLISKDKVSEKYWNNSSKIISEKLSFHHQIDFQDLGQGISSNGFLEGSEEPLRYLATKSMRVLTRNSLKTSLKLLQSSQLDTMEEEATQITRKIRIYPNPEQKKLFKKCSDSHRYFYNKAIEQFNKNEKIEDEEEKSRANTFFSVRNEVVINNCDLSEEDNNMWMKEVPYDTRQLAVKTAISARESAFANLHNNNITHFKMKFINKKTSNNVFYINKKALINGALFKRKLKGNLSNIISSRNKGKDRNAILNDNCGDFLIKQEKDNRYYICLVVKQKDTILDQRKNICALDPGVRTFQTMYSQRSAGEFGFDTSKIIYNLYRREDKIKSILAKNELNSKTKYKLKRRCALLRTKIKHVVSDLHWKTADYLTKKFQVILLPIFGTKNMTNRSNRRISKTTTRLLLGLSHYDFQQKLLYKADKRGRDVILCKEHYTTKCCGKCGTLNETIGSKKIFQCGNCDLVMDRDIHAARNILIRGLTIYSDTLSDKLQSVKKSPLKTSNMAVLNT